MTDQSITSRVDKFPGAGLTLSAKEFEDFESGGQINVETPEEYNEGDKIQVSSLEGGKIASAKVVDRVDKADSGFIVTLEKAE